MEKFPHGLGLKSLDPLFRVSKQGPCITTIEEDGGDKRLVQLELACTVREVLKFIIAAANKRGEGEGLKPVCRTTPLSLILYMVVAVVAEVGRGRAYSVCRTTIPFLMLHVVVVEGAREGTYSYNFLWSNSSCGGGGGGKGGLTLCAEQLFPV